MTSTAGPETSTVAELPEALRHVPAVLLAEFPERVSEGDVERTVVEIYAELASSARIAAFLPILTEKVARDRLAEVTGQRAHRHGEAA
jgi:hypothetical protein